MKPLAPALATALMLAALGAVPGFAAQQKTPPSKPAPAPAQPAAKPAPGVPQRGAPQPAEKPAASAPAPPAAPPAPQGAPQTPAPAQPEAAPPPSGQAGAKPEPGAPFTYNPEGRRDPFVSLLGKGSDPKGSGSRPPGVPGLLINEVSVKGIVRNSNGYVALIQGADNKTYVVKAGDRLLDGTVKSIVQDAVVFSQDVNDPLSLVKQKEIRKPLRSAEGGRG